MVQVIEGRTADVGGVSVRRSLPTKGRRHVGAWCFADHMGPVDVTPQSGLDIGPHPHTGLQTVTWLSEGEALHRDSLGTEQLIRPGQLNLMSAGRGVSHSEEATESYGGRLQGLQLWIAQPETTRHGPPSFEHHGELPAFEGPGLAGTVLIGSFMGSTSPARRDSELVGAELHVEARATLGLRPDFEYALVVIDGVIEVDGEDVRPGRLAVFDEGIDEIKLRAPHGPARVLLLGGVPFDEPLLMWWNFVARSRDEIDAAYASWRDDDGRFGVVASGLARIPTAPPAWWGRTPSSSELRERR